MCTEDSNNLDRKGLKKNVSLKSHCKLVQLVKNTIEVYQGDMKHEHQRSVQRG